MRRSGCLSSAPCKSLFVIRLCRRVTRITWSSRFGSASASVMDNKEAANSSNMTYTLFDSSRHFPKMRSGWRNGILHRLS